MYLESPVRVQLPVSSNLNERLLGSKVGMKKRLYCQTCPTYLLSWYELQVMEQNVSYHWSGKSLNSFFHMIGNPTLS